MAKAIIIDDNELNLETMMVLLRREGLESIALVSPHQLEKRLAGETDFAVVFLDLEFPNYDGMQLVKDLRGLSHLKGVPIIAYSVHISEQDEIREAGFDGFLGKPLNVSKFPDQLRRILDGELVWEVGQ